MANGGGRTMKCEENGGCPFLCLEFVATPDSIECETSCRKCTALGKWLIQNPLDDCHLTPDLFPIIRAMIAGEVEIETERVTQYNPDRVFNRTTIEWQK